MIGFLLELTAFQMALDFAYRNAAKKAYRKYVWTVRDQYAQFARWAEKNPHHALTQNVAAEMLALNQSLTISPTQKAEQALVIAQNAYILLTQLPQSQEQQRIHQQQAAQLTGAGQDMGQPASRLAAQTVTRKQP